MREGVEEMQEQEGQQCQRPLKKIRTTRNGKIFDLTSRVFIRKEQ